MVVRQAFQSKVNQGFAQGYLETDKMFNILEECELHIPQINLNDSNWSSCSSTTPGTCVFSMLRYNVLASTSCWSTHCLGLLLDIKSTITCFLHHPPWL